MSFNYCCELGKAIDEDRVLYESDNFFGVAALGPLETRGYLLLVSKEHHLGFGMMNDSLMKEAEEVIGIFKGVIKSVYKKSPLIFEHGPRIGIESGACIDHAHLHFIPGVDITHLWASDLINRIEDPGMFFRVDNIEGFERARELSLSPSSYLLMESPEGKRFISEQNFYRPKQYFRRMVAKEINSLRWDWRNNLDENIVSKTIEDLVGKF